MSDTNSIEPTRHAPAHSTADRVVRASDLPETEDSQHSPANAPTSVDKTPLSTPPQNDGMRTGFPVVPGYEILEEIGRGGMGVVYKARQLTLNRLVALKVILAGAHADKSQLTRFYGEARAVARLRHPHIVQIYDIGEHDGLPYFSLELIEGGSLAQRIAKQPQPPAVAAYLVELLARAVHFAHTQGIIHRDLKPANILLEKTEDSEQRTENRGQKTDKSGASATGSSWLRSSSVLWPKITDFGLAKSLENEAQTHSSAVMGTPSYMPPEQARGDSGKVGPAADQYALGAILYDLLTGRPPFKGTTLLDTLDQVQTREPVPPSQLQTNIPADLETICLKCLQKDPRKRYGSTLELADDLRRFQEGTAIVARPVGSMERSLRWARRNPRVAALLGAIAFLLLALVGVSWFFTAALFKAKGEADDNARIADNNARAAEQQAALFVLEKAAVVKAKGEADDHARAAAEHARVAEKQTELAIDALAALVYKAQTLLEELPNSARTRQELLKLALEKFQSVEGAYKPGVTDRAMAQAHLKMGDIYLLNKQKNEALQHYEKGRDLMAALYKAAPDNDKDMGNYAVFLRKFGEWKERQDGDRAAARDYYKQALRLQLDALNVTGPAAELTQAEKKMSVAGTHDQLGVLAFNQGHTDEADEHFREALTLREAAFPNLANDESRLMLAQSHKFLAAVEARRQHPEAVLEHHVSEQTYRRQVCEANPSNVAVRADLAELSRKVGEMQFGNKDYETAQRSFDEHLKLRRAMYAANSGNGAAQRAVSQALYMSAATAQARHDKAAAQKGFEECVRLRREYVKAVSNDINGHIELMLALARTGAHAEAVEIAEQEVRKRAGKNGRYVFQIACCYALCLDAVEAEEDKAKYAAKGVEALQQARALGHKDVKAIDTEPDLEPLRQRAEFVAYRQTLPK